MSDANRGPSDDETAWKEVEDDRLCDRFEFLRMAGQAVTVGDFLAGQGIDPAHADPDLIRELDRLAAYYDPKQRPTVAAPTAPTPPPLEPLLRPGVVLAGKYKLVERIGGGGMGDVWMAQQTEPVKRLVAVKVIKVGLNSERFVARFDAERQALARMDHPNIARVFDAGVASIPDERGHTVTIPFFVMELVKGVPIAQFCDERKLTVRQRLELFVPICHAIQHAHQKGVIHRDIKPGNVLVALYDDRPVPKVIDFGLAKATAEPLTEHTLVSAFGAVVGTLVYMSPEQAGLNQADIDTRSDVYSLGVLLYELLTGEPPLDRKSVGRAALHEVLRMVREVDAPKPSARASSADAAPAAGVNCGLEPKRLSRLLRGDLDWVLLKALEKDRGRRYDSPTAFAADVQRYLANEPVSVGPPSAAYRLRKFVRRNRAAVAAGLTVFVALVAGVTGTTLGLLEARQARADEAERADGERKAKEMAEEATRREAGQRAKAERAFGKAADVLDTLTSEVTGRSLTTQQEITPEQKQLLTEVVTFYEEFVRETAADDAGRTRVARTAFRLGLIQDRLGRAEEALTAFAAARGRFQHLADRPEATPEIRKQLAWCHHNLGVQLNRLGRDAEAEAEYRAALGLKARLADEQPAEAEYRHDLAHGYRDLGALLHASGRLAEAAAEYRRAVALEEALIAVHPKVADYRHALAVTRNRVGCLHVKLGDGTAAEESHRRALALSLALCDEFPRAPVYRGELANGHTCLGYALTTQGKKTDAEVEYRKALTVWEQLATDFPSVPAYRRGWAVNQLAFGAQLGESGRPAEAEVEFRRALATQEKLADDHPTVADYRSGAAISRIGLGFMLAAAGKPADADAELRTAATALERLTVGSPPGTSPQGVALGRCYSALGRVADRGGKVAEADRWFQLAIDTLQPFHRRDPVDGPVRKNLRDSFAGRAGTRCRLSRDADAAADWAQVVALSEPAQLAWAHFQHGCALDRAGDRTAADAAFERGLALRQQAAQPTAPREEHWLLAIYLIECGRRDMSAGRNERAVAWMSRAVVAFDAFARKWPGTDATYQLRWSHQNRAVLLGRLEKFAQAIPDWDRAAELAPDAERPRVLASGAYAKARAGQPTAAVAQAAPLTARSEWTPSQWYGFASIYAAAATAGEADKRAEYADRAVVLFGKAVAAGYRDAAAVRRDAEFDPLRHRDDFKRLVAAIERSPELAPPPRPAK